MFKPLNRLFDRQEHSKAHVYKDDPENFPSKTVQSMRDECDINIIMKRFGQTGELPPAGAKVPSYGDYEGIDDFHTAMNVIREAQESFMMMPGAVRARFNNDPQMFLEFCSDPENLPEMRKLGLAIPAPVVDNTPKSSDVPAAKKE